MEKIYLPADWLIPLLDRQRIKQVHFIFSYVFALCQKGEHCHCKNLLILRSFVDLLNYPFKKIMKKIMFFFCDQ